MAKGPLDLPLVHALVAVKAVRGPEDPGTELTSYECGDGGAVIVPVHAVLQGTLLPDIAARSARKIDITNVAVEPPDDGRVE